MGTSAYDDTDTPISLRPPSAGLLAAATNRLATILITGTRFVDETLYRLTDYRLAADGLHATFALGSFGQYALTGDLLESEATAAADTGSAAGMPLRDELLPTVESVLAARGRLCVGGTLALAAFARPALGSRPADFLLLLQERGEQVLNAGHRLAVIPKCFHQPMVDLVEDAHIGATLLRELEEELFGREEVDNSLPHPAFVEPMHRTRLSRPLRWLWAHPASWVMEGTGFAFNLLTGNFEVPALIAVRDEKFWQRHGGAVQANWESTRLIRMSSMDADGLAKLLADPAWSDEGLMAFVLGLKRLARLDPARVKPAPVPDRSTSLTISAGNAFADGDKHRGWLVGNFIEPPDSVLNSGDVEIKWGVHPAGEERSDWTTGETRTSFMVLISGRFIQRLPDRQVELTKPGDYVSWGPGVVHAWRAIEDSVLLTVRWPSV